MTPTTPAGAFKLGEKIDDPLSMYLQDVFTLPPSLAGIPAVSVPCGLTPERLPLGLQLAAPQFEEAKLVRIAAAFERASGWAERPPGF
jgi:aspartyl-tRNA(Asn)/glutamyl-tRNA(Gln) amidotransferase subunit A